MLITSASSPGEPVVVGQSDMKKPIVVTNNVLIDGLPKIHLDYVFVGSRGEKTEEEDSTIVLAFIMKGNHLKMTMVSVVPKKGFV